jgi:hypothetical protein
MKSFENIHVLVYLGRVDVKIQNKSPVQIGYISWKNFENCKKALGSTLEKSMNFNNTVPILYTRVNNKSQRGLEGYKKKHKFTFCGFEI